MWIFGNNNWMNRSSELQSEHRDAAEPLFKTLKPKRLHLPLKDTHRGSALTHRFHQHSIQTQLKLSQRLFPKLESRSFSRKKKEPEFEKGFLEQWISNQLEDEEAQGQLKAIRKYEIDRKTLLNMQVAPEEIDKLYQTLYVYSHGVKNTFFELVGKNEELMVRFWRVYILLLEDRNVSTVVEKRHRQSLNIVMGALQGTEQQLQTLKKQFEDRERELCREVVFKEDQIQKVKDERDVIESNFLLTDEAFNEEVSRRLKFEEKINEINTVYNQLKAKYVRLVEELSVHHELDNNYKEKRKLVQSEIKGLEGRNIHLEKQLEDTRSKLKQTEEDYVKVKGEIHELKQEQLKMVRDDEKEYLQLKDVLIREKKYKLQLHNETEAKLKIETLVVEKTKEIELMSKQVEMDRGKVEVERKRKMELDTKVNSLNKALEEKDQRFRETEYLNSMLVITQKADKRQIGQLNEALTNLKNVELFQIRTIASLESNTTSLVKTLEELKSAKHKYQTLSEGLTLENAKLLSSVKELKNSEFSLREANRDLTLKLVEKESEENTKENGIKNELAINKQKIKSLSNQLSNKEKLSCQLTDKITKLRESIIEKEYQKEQLKESFIELQRKYNHELIDKRSLESRISARDEELERMKNDFKEMCQELMGVKSQDIGLIKRNEELLFIQENFERTKGLELESIKKILASYRKQIKSMTTYVHPMDYWSSQGQLARMAQKYEYLALQLSEREEETGRFETQLKNLNEDHRLALVTIESLNNGILNQKEVANLLDKSLHEKISAFDQVTADYARYKGQMETRLRKLSQSNSRLTQEKSTAEADLQQWRHRPTSTKSTQTEQLSISTTETQTEFPKPQPRVQLPTLNLARTQMVDVETETSGLAQPTHYNKYLESDDSQLLSPRKSIDKDKSVEMQKQNPNRSQSKTSRRNLPKNVEEDDRSSSKTRDNHVLLKPVSKGDFSRAMRLTFLRK